jgi:hypothetical protein
VEKVIPWNKGIVEDWNDDKLRQKENFFFSLNPLFQYSSFPIFHLAI